MRKDVLLSFIILLVFLPFQPVQGETVDLLLFNVWNGLESGGFFSSRALEEPGTREFRRELLERGIESYKPDLLGLLELNPLPRTAEELAEEFSFTMISQVDRGGIRVGVVGLPANLRSGMALFSGKDYPLEARSMRKLSGGIPGGFYQIGSAAVVLAGETEIADRKIHLFITHWEESLYSSREDLRTLVDEYDREELETRELTRRIRSAAEGEALRLKQAAATLDFINQTAGGDPAVLMGTLASAPGSAVLELLKNAGFRDTWNLAGGATWDEEGNPNTSHSGDLYTAGVSSNRVDYVLVRGEGIRGRSSRIVFNRETYGTFPSDHYGLLVNLEIDEDK